MSNEDHKSLLITAKAVKVLHMADEPDVAAMASTKAAVKLAELVLAMEAKRELELAQRAIPIDGEWLESIGFADKGTAEKPFYSIANDFHAVEVKTLTVRLVRHSSGLGMTIGMITNTTRGMMIDFLNGLLIPHKATA